MVISDDHHCSILGLTFSKLVGSLSVLQWSGYVKINFKNISKNRESQKFAHILDFQACKESPHPKGR